jgi:tetratricopeptide repeat protein 4
VLSVDEGNLKALYRSARACLAIDKVVEAEDAIDRALTIESSAVFLTLQAEIVKRRKVIEAREQENRRAAARKRDEERALSDALKVGIHDMAWLMVV